MDDRRRSIARWQQAEAKIYPLVMVDADGYQQAVAAVSSVVGVLRREARDVDALEALAADPDGLASRADLDDRSLPGGLTMADVVDGACAIRQREIEAETTANRWIAAVEVARRAGEEWAEVHDLASPLGQLGVPELRVEAASGVGVHTTLTIDPSTADPQLLLILVRVDLDRRLVSGLDVDARVVATDRSAWSSAVSELRRAVLDQDHERGIYRPSEQTTRRR